MRKLIFDVVVKELPFGIGIKKTLEKVRVKTFVLIDRLRVEADIEARSRTIKRNSLYAGRINFVPLLLVLIV